MTPDKWLPDGWSIRPGRAAESPEPPDVWPSLMVWMERRQTEDPESLTFLDDRIGELPAAARPTHEERERLKKALEEALAPVSDADWIVNIDQLPEGGRRFFAAPRSASLARVWPAVFRAWQLAHVPAIAARALLLDAHDSDGDERTKHEKAEATLAAAIRDELPELLTVVGEPPHPDARARAVEWLRARPLRGVKTYARKVARTAWASEEWADPWKAALFIGGALWKLKVRDELPAFARPGLPSELVTNLNGFNHMQGDMVRGLERSKTMGRPVQSWTDAPKRGTPVVGLDIPVVKGRTGKSRLTVIDPQSMKPELLRGLPAKRLLRFVMHRSHELYEETGVLELSLRITVRGGWTQLAEELGMGRGEKAAKTVELTAKHLQAAWVRTPLGIEGGLFVLTVDHSGTRDDWSVSLTIDREGWLSPRYSARLLQGKSPKLVPTPLPSLMPPFVGRPNEHGAQADLQLLVLRELRLKAPELVKRKGVVITKARWEALLKEVGLPLLVTREDELTKKRTKQELLPELLDAWTKGDKAFQDFAAQRKALAEEAGKPAPTLEELAEAWKADPVGVPPFITLDGERVDLTPFYAAERRFIIEGGQKTISGRSGGLSSARKQLRG